MNEKLKKIMNISNKIFTWVLIVFTVCTVIFTLVTVLTVDKNERSIFGFRFYNVLTDSMSKSELNKDDKVHFNAGDIIIVQEVTNFSTLKEGDIISFMSANTDSLGETITHMIDEVRRDSDGKLLGYVTKGTNTGARDEALVQPEYVLGEYVGKLPGLGHFFAFAQTIPGYIVCILIPFLLLILYNGVTVIHLFRKYKKEQNDAIAAERQQIEDERAENQRMMAELLELKAQLMKNNAEALASVEKTAEEQSDAATSDANNESETTSPDEKSDETNV